MNYEKMTDDDFDLILSGLIDAEYSDSPSRLLQIPGIYEILSEHFNNAVLDRWEYEQEQDKLEHDEEE